MHAGPGTSAAWWVAVAVSLAACGAPPPVRPHEAAPSAQVRADLDRAEHAELARRHDLARAAYEQAVADAHDPTSIAIARRDFAETLETWGETAEAIAQLQAAVAVAPRDVAAWHDLGILYHVQGDDRRATEALEHAVQLAPDSVKVRIALAAVYQCTGDRARAIAAYRALLQLDLPDELRAKIRYWVGVLEHTTELPRCHTSASRCDAARPGKAGPCDRPAPSPYA